MFVLVQCAQLNNKIKNYCGQKVFQCIFWMWTLFAFYFGAFKIIPYKLHYVKLHSSMLNTAAVGKDCFLKHISQCVIKMYAFMFKNKSEISGFRMIHYNDPWHIYRSGQHGILPEDTIIFYAGINILFWVRNSSFVFHSLDVCASFFGNWHEGWIYICFIDLTFTFKSWSKRMFSSLRSRCTTAFCKRAETHMRPCTAPPSFLQSDVFSLHAKTV